MVTMSEKGRVRSSRNIFTRAAAQDTVITRTVLPLHQIKTVDKDMKRHRMILIKNNKGKYDG